MPVRLGLVDSGIALTQQTILAAAIDLSAAHGVGTMQSRASDDALAHGTAVANIVLGLAPQVRLLDAQAFGQDRQAEPIRVAQAIEWCVAQRAQVINLSFGLRGDHIALRVACAAAIAEGVILVASWPARGGSVYPAAYPGVIAVCGDARCAENQWSEIETRRLYGAPACAADGRTPGGASYATARLSGHAARYLDMQPTANVEGFRAWLTSAAAFHGRECRTSRAA